jgi:hypothetical protein
MQCLRRWEWNKKTPPFKESVKAKIKVIVKLILHQYDTQSMQMLATETVLKQRS